MRRKWFLISAAALAGIFIIAIIVFYVVLINYDFNKFKPQITKFVKDATGRELTLGGDLVLDIDFTPSLSVQNVTFGNAPWGTRPDLAKIKQLKVEMALLPLIRGHIDVKQLILIEPDVLVETDASGRSNFDFKPTETQPDETIIPLFAFKKIHIEKGVLHYRDGTSNQDYKLNLDLFNASASDFNSNIKLDMGGRFRDKYFEIKGEIGSVTALIRPSVTCPIELSAILGSASVNIEGSIKDTLNFKDFSGTLTAKGSSISEILDAAGVMTPSDLGPFHLTAKISDANNIYTVESINLKAGTEDLAQLILSGTIQNLNAFEGIRFDFETKGKDIANLEKITGQALPINGTFSVSGKLLDTAPGNFKADGLKVAFGENIISGTMDLELTDKNSRMAAALSSQNIVLTPPQKPPTLEPASKKILKRDPLNLGPLNLSVSLEGIREAPILKTLEFSIGSKQLALLKVSGSIQNLMALQNVHFKFNAQGKDFENLRQLTAQVPSIKGPFAISGKIVDPAIKQYAVQDLKITVAGQNMTGKMVIDLNGPQPKLKAQFGAKKIFPHRIIATAASNVGDKNKTPDLGPLNLKLTVVGPIGSPSLKAIDFKMGNEKGGTTTLNGSVKQLVKLQGMKINFLVKGKEVRTIEELLGRSLPVQGPFSISGQVIDRAKHSYRAENLQLVLTKNELKGLLDINTAEGQLQLAADLSAQKINLQPLKNIKNQTIVGLKRMPNLGPLQLKGKIIIQAGKLSIKNLTVQTGTERLAKLQVQGSIEDVKALKGMKLDFSARGNEVTKLADLSGQNLPIQGAFGVTGHFADKAERIYKLSGLKINLGESHLSGRIDADLSGQTPRLSAALESEKLNLKPLRIKTLAPLSALSDLGPLKLAIKIDGLDDTINIEDLDLMLGSEELAAITLKGSMKKVSTLEAFDLDFSVKGNDLRNIKKLGGPPFSYDGAFHVSGQIADSASKQYQLSNLNIIWGENDVKGTVSLNLNQKRPQIVTALSFQKADLRPFLVKTNIPKDQKRAPIKKKDKVFSSEPWPIETLERIDADIKLQGQQLLLKKLALDDLTAHFVLDNGTLTAKPVKFNIGGGMADAHFIVNSQNDEPAIEFSMKMDQFEIGPMLDVLGYERKFEGAFSSNIELFGQGRSLAEAMAGLDGEIFMMVNNGQFAGKILDKLEQILGARVLNLLNPFKQDPTKTKVNCLTNLVRIKDGDAVCKLLLDTEQTSIFGGGQIDLKTEKLNFSIKPNPKKGYGHSDIGKVDVNLSSLSRTMKLGGTLADPSLTVDKMGTTILAGKFVGGFLFGPLGLAAVAASEFIDFSKGDKNPCRTAIEEAKKTIHASGEGKSAAEKSDTTVKKIGEKVKSLFKR